MDDIVARYTLKFNDLCSKGLLRSASAAKAFSMAGTAAIAGIGILTAGVIALGKASFGLAGQWSEYLDNLDETSAKAGLSATYTRNLGMALADMGVDQESANKGFIKFNQNLGKFRASGIPKQLNKLGGNFNFLTNKTLSTEDALQKTLETIAKIPDSANRAAALGTVFGKAGVMMGAAVEDIAALNAGMKIYNDILGVVGPKQLKDASDYQSALLQAGAAWTAIKMAIGAQAAPLFIPLIKNFITFLVANKDKITSGFAAAFEKLGASMAQVDWGSFMDSIVKLLGYMPKLVTAFIWVIDHIGTIAAVLAAVKVTGFLGQIGLLSAGFSKFGSLLRIVATGAGYLGPLIGNLAKFFVGGLGGALTRVLPLLAGLSAPVWVIIGVIGALIAVGYLLYKNWDKVKAGAIALGSTIMSAWNAIDSATGGFLSKLITAAGAILSLVFAPIKAGIALLSGDFNGALNIMKNAWGAAWNAMGAVLSGIWSGIKNVVATGVNFLIDQINTLISKWNGFAPSFASIGSIPNIGAATTKGTNSAAGRQSVAVAVTVKGEVKGAKMQAPSVKTSQASRGKGGNHPAGSRR